MRVLGTLLAALVVAAIAAPPAEAHGGNFRVGDPIPGPPLPPTRGPGGRGPVTPPPLPGGLGTASRQRTKQDWVIWWSLNVESWDPRRRSLDRATTISVTPGDADGDEASATEARRISRLLFDRARDRVALPLLEELVDPERGHPPTLVGAALIAWARTSDGGDALPVLRRYALDPYVSLEVRESAVLGLGLLRRSDPALQLPVEALARIRDDLLLILDDGHTPERIRSFACFALGLLADQPFGERPPAARGCLVARSLALRLRDPGLPEDVRVALLVALGMHPPEGVADGVRAELQRLVLKGTAFGSTWTWVERCHALQTLARLGSREVMPVLRRVMSPREHQGDGLMLVAGANALADVAPALSADERRVVAAWLLDTLPSVEEPQDAGLLYVALGALLGADLDDGSTALLDEVRVGPFLVRATRAASLDLRPWAALGLAVAAREERPASRPAAVFRAEASKALDWGLRHTRGADAILSAYAAAVGLAQVDAARPALRALLEDADLSPVVRGFAARALGMLGQRDDDTVEVLIAATREGVSPIIRVQATHALGLLAAPGACDAVLAQLDGDPTQGAMVAAALSLGRIRDPKAADRLAAIARNPDAGVEVRAMAVVALGLIFDPEDPSSRVRLRQWASYFGLTASYRTVLGIL